MNVILKGEKSVMKLKRKLLAGLLTLCMAVGMAVPAFAAGDPLTISFYYGGAEYGYYQMGWVDVGDIDTDAGRCGKPRR